MLLGSLAHAGTHDDFTTTIAPPTTRGALPEVFDDDAESMRQAFEAEGFEVELNEGDPTDFFCAAKTGDFLDAAPFLGGGGARKPDACCFCEYYNQGDLDKKCGAVVVTLTSKPPDTDCESSGGNRTYVNRFNVRCDGFLVSRQCPVAKKKFALDGDNDAVGVSKLKAKYKCEYVEYSHQGHGYGPGTFSRKVEVCLNVCPGCRKMDATSSGCNVFTNIDDVRKNQVQKLAAKLKAEGRKLKVSLTAHQTIAGPQDSRYQFCIDTSAARPLASERALDRCFPDQRKCDLDDSGAYHVDHDVNVKCLDERNQPTQQTCCRGKDKTWRWIRGKSACEREVLIGVYKGEGRVEVRDKAGKLLDSITRGAKSPKEVRKQIGEFAQGGEYTVTVVPAPGYEVCGWGGYGDVWGMKKFKETPNKRALTLKRDTAITVAFCLKKKS